MTTTHADAMHRDISAKDAWDAFGLGGLIGAVGVDIARFLTGQTSDAFALVFAGEGALFLAAAWLAVGVGRGAIARKQEALA